MKTALFSLLLFVASASLAQAGHFRDSIMAKYRTCTDCSKITITTDTGSTIAMSYTITGGVRHTYHFDASDFCVRYEEWYPSLGYLTPVAAYMDANYIKTGLYQWEEELRTTAKQTITDRIVRWHLIIKPSQSILVVAELKKK